MYVSTKQRQEMIFNKMGITSAQKVITYAHKITTSGLRSSLSEVKLNGDPFLRLHRRRQSRRRRRRRRVVVGISS